MIKLIKMYWFLKSLDLIKIFNEVEDFYKVTKKAFKDGKVTPSEFKEMSKEFGDIGFVAIPELGKIKKQISKK